MKFFSLCLILLAALVLFGCKRSPEYYLGRGNEFFSAQKYDDAVIQYRKALQANPNLGEAYYRLGLIEMERNRGLEAYSLMRQAVQLMPAGVEPKIRLADLSLALYVVYPREANELYAQVEKLAGELLAQDKNSYDGFRLKGSLRLLDKHPEEAIASFEQANRIRPMRPELVEGLVQALFMAGRNSDAEKLAFQMIAKDKSFGAIYDVLYRQYTALNRPADAEKILKLKVANNPKEIGAALQLARHYHVTNRDGEMTAVLQQVLDKPQEFPNGRLAAGDFYGGIGRRDEALKIYQKGAEIDSRERLVYRRRMVDTLLAMGRRNEARELVSSLMKEAPDDADSRRVRAAMLLQEGGRENVSAAAAELRSLAEKQPDDVRVRHLLAEALIILGDKDAAKSEYQRIAAGNRGDLGSRLALAAMSLDQNQPDEALRYADEILRDLPENTAARLSRAQALTGAGRLNEARGELSSLRARYPKSAEVEYQLALLAIAEKKYGEAQRILSQLNLGSGAEPRHAAALAETYSAQGQFAQAMEIVNAALRKSPNSSALHRYLAATAVKAGKFDVAVAEYTQMMANEPQSVTVRRELAEVYRQQGQLASAITVLEKAIPLAPNDPDVPMALASLQATAGQHKAALENLHRVLAMRPDNPFILNNIAYVMAESGGNLDEALRLQQRAILKSPGNPVLTDTLGMIYLKKGMADSALKTFGNLARQEPVNPTYHYHYALALLASGDRKRASVELEAARSNRPPPELLKQIAETTSAMQK